MIITAAIARFLPEGRNVKVRIPLGCGLTHDVHNLYDLTGLERIGRGNVSVYIGISRTISVEQFFWYQFWHDKAASGDIDTEMYDRFTGRHIDTITLRSDDAYWLLTQGCIIYNGMYIVPCTGFKVRDFCDVYMQQVMCDKEGRVIDMVALSMALSECVLY